jgi:hypothetical protein
VANAQLAFRRSLNNVTAIHVHHASKLGHNHIEKPIKVDRSWQVQRQTIDDRLTRLVHLDFALER